MIVRNVLNWTVAVFISAAGMLLGTANQACGDSWKSAIHDANALFSASRNLHDRAEHFYDAHVLECSARLEQHTAQLVTMLKAEACLSEVMPVYRAIGSVLEDVSACVQLSHAMRVDRRSQVVLADARRFYAATGEHLQCVHPSLPAPVITLPHVSGYPGYPVIDYPPTRVMTAPPQLSRQPLLISPSTHPRTSSGPWNGQPDYRLQGTPDLFVPGAYPGNHAHAAVPRGFEIRFRLP